MLLILMDVLIENRLKGVDAIDINGCIDRKSVERSGCY